MKKILLMTFVLLFVKSNVTFAASANYFGVVTRVAFYKDDGSFVVTINSNELDDCKYKYAYFDAAKIGIDRVKMAYTMAMTSITTKMTMNFVIDKSVISPGDNCYVGGMVAGIQSY